MEIFIKSTDPLLHYNNDDVVLDVGCGPCFLAEFLKDRVKEIHCVDISDSYIGICRRKFAQHRNVFFYNLHKDNYTDLSILKTRKFSIIVCLSVIQYYRSVDEVGLLIEEVRRLSVPGAKFLIADIPTTNGAFLDMWSILKSSLKENYFLETIRHLFKNTISTYHRVLCSSGLLVFSNGSLEDLIRKHDLDAQIISTPMTPLENRQHLLIRL
ncbi:TPA: class I SAM-dependent methyltransferase [Candidatus Poribacteria bacterium]|nr:class I SAM-dependent methyltransferase [Candidatus Poribacteria bacterium]